jgi:hypothetical protein
MMERFKVMVLDADGVVDRFTTVEEARAAYPESEFRIEVESDETYDKAEAEWAAASD